MSLTHALDRFTDLLSRLWPEHLEQLRPGLEDAALEELRAAVAPFVVPEQVETLYRWRNGGDSGIFGGWRMRPLDDLLEWYRFTITDLQSPATWLPVFDAQMVNIVTLDVDGQPPSDPSVWYGHTHDGWLERLFNSLDGLVETVTDAAEHGGLVPDHGRLCLRSTSVLDDNGWERLRLQHNPGAFTYPEPPSGTYLPRFPDQNYPDPWPRAWTVGWDAVPHENWGI